MPIRIPFLLFQIFRTGSRAPGSISVPIESFHRFKKPKRAITPRISTISPSFQYCLKLFATESSTAFGITELAQANSRAAFSASVNASWVLKSQMFSSLAASALYLSAARMVCAWQYTHPAVWLLMYPTISSTRC